MLSATNPHGWLQVFTPTKPLLYRVEDFSIDGACHLPGIGWVLVHDIDETGDKITFRDAFGIKTTLSMDWINSTRGEDFYRVEESH